MQFISFNGSKFDFPILIKQGLAQGVFGKEPKNDIVLYELKNACEVAWKTTHVDLLSSLGKYGTGRKKDEYVEIYLGIKPTPIDFDTCTDEELKEHCLEDLDQTEKLYNLFKSII